jgi:hypothetical protein
MRLELHLWNMHIDAFLSWSWVFTFLVTLVYNMVSSIKTVEL